MKGHGSALNPLQKNLLRKIVRNILLLVNAFLAILLVIIYLSVYISPATSWIFAFIALSYPFVLILNILFILFWLVFRKWYFVLSLFCILLGWNSLKRFFQIEIKHPDPVVMENTICLLTYNVRLFNYYQWNEDTSAWQKIINYIHTEDPDIVCFQEFITLPGTPHDLNSMKKKMAPLIYSHVYYTDRVPGKINFGMATFSKYPILGKKKVTLAPSLNGIIYSDVVIHNDTIRIYNCHLQSIKLRKDYNNLLDNLIFNYSEKQLHELKDISVRMQQAYIQRAEQVDILVKHIQSSPYPVIVCGDFNDTPVSYTYNKLSGNLKDAFIEAGSGIGNTFRGNFPYVRIDYVLYSAPFKAHHYHTKKINLSDHYPVITNFTIAETADSSNLNSPPKE
jgi:endonuclease/exonuclease/phosphatase family metal-dependent hydrolase